MQKPISTKMHAVLDYLTVGTFLALPRLLGCSRTFTNQVTCLALGKLAYTLCTKHELGVVKVIPMKVHLLMDGVAGATMAALPFLEDEDEATKMTFLAMGLFDIAAAPLTETEPPAVAGHASTDVTDGEPGRILENESVLAR